MNIHLGSRPFTDRRELFARYPGNGGRRTGVCLRRSWENGASENMIPESKNAATPEVVGDRAGWPSESRLNESPSGKQWEMLPCGSSNVIGREVPEDEAPPEG